MYGDAAWAPLRSRDAEVRPEPGLRILAVGNMYPPHHAGGYELMWQAATLRARERGHQVRILVSDHRELGVQAQDDPDVHRTLRWYWDLSRYEFPRLGPAERLWLERHNAAELDRHLTAFVPDIVAWWSMGCMSLSLIERVRRAGIPAVSVVHDDWVVYGPEHDQWIRMWRGPRRALAPVAERIFGIPTQIDLAGSGPFVFNSSYTKRRAHAAGLAPRSEQVVHPGIDAGFLRAAPAKPWAWRLVSVGRIDRQKGIDTAVAALAHLPPEATLTIWGTGDEQYTAEMVALATRLGLRDRVTFAGWAEAEQLPDIYANADAVLFPVRWEEPFGLVPLEAMGVGCPVVSTRRGGASEFLEAEENALLVDVDDPEGIAAALVRLASDETLRLQLIAGGHRTASRYTVRRFAELTVDAIVNAAAGPGSEDAPSP